EGLFYQLPRTVISVALPVKNVKMKVGPYEELAACLFPNEAARIVHKTCQSFELGDPKIDTRGEPDPSETYMIKMRGNYFEDKAITLALNEGGVPTKITEDTTNHAVEIVTQAAQTISSLILQSTKPQTAAASSADEEALDDAIKNLD